MNIAGQSRAYDTGNALLVRWYHPGGNERATGDPDAPKLGF